MKTNVSEARQGLGWRSNGSTTGRRWESPGLTSWDFPVHTRQTKTGSELQCEDPVAGVPICLRGTSLFLRENGKIRLKKKKTGKIRLKKKRQISTTYNGEC